MKNEKSNNELNQVDDKIQNFIKKKKDENSALKKLLSALEKAKKNATIKTII
jgi:hypothetical protein